MVNLTQITQILPEKIRFYVNTEMQFLVLHWILKTLLMKKLSNNGNSVQNAS